MRRALHRVKTRRIILIASWTIALMLGLGLLLSASPQLQRAVLTSEAVRDASPLSETDALERHANVRAYLYANAETIEGATTDEVSHMHDVRRLYEILAGVALIAAAFGIGALRADREAWSLTSIKRIALSIIGTVGAITLIGLLGFSALFRAFHLFFFPQGNWTFPADSFLITLYPQVFFALMAAWIGIGILVVATLAYLLTRTK